MALTSTLVPQPNACEQQAAQTDRSLSAVPSKLNKRSFALRIGWLHAAMNSHQDFVVIICPPRMKRWDHRAEKTDKQKLIVQPCKQPFPGHCSLVAIL
eukprot:137060-Amphidinium_carterae.1